MTYTQELTQAMARLAKDDRTLFVGQTVEYGGIVMAKTFSGIPAYRKIEMPVAEDFQMGFCTGLSLAGFVPICIYPRWDFLLLAANQLINHLDKIPLMGDFKPKVIIRVAIASNKPLDAGPQHTGNYTRAFNLMLKTVRIIDLREWSDVCEAYEMALVEKRSVIVVEEMARYD